MAERSRDGPLTWGRLAEITTKYAAKGKTVTILNLNEDSAKRNELLAGQLGAGH